MVVVVLFMSRNSLAFLSFSSFLTSEGGFITGSRSHRCFLRRPSLAISAIFVCKVFVIYVRSASSSHAAKHFSTYVDRDGGHFSSTLEEEEVGLSVVFVDSVVVITVAGC